MKVRFVYKERVYNSFEAAVLDNMDSSDFCQSKIEEVVIMSLVEFNQFSVESRLRSGSND